jgi:hypothetical protein
MKVMASVRSEPDMASLLDCIAKLAARMAIAAPAESLARERLTNVLVERGNIEAARQGLISHAELVQLVLAHVHTLLVPDASVPLPITEEIAAKVERALLA